MSVNVNYHSFGEGTCFHCGKVAEGHTVTFGEYVNQFFCRKSLENLIRMRLRLEAPRAAAQPAAPAVVPVNGEVES